MKRLQEKKEDLEKNNYNNNYNNNINLLYRQ